MNCRKDVYKRQVLRPAYTLGGSGGGIAHNAVSYTHLTHGEEVSGFYSRTVNSAKEAAKFCNTKYFSELD